LKIEKVSDTITKVFFDNKKELILVGTAHVSQDSVAEVSNLIETEKPDRLCIELDDGRLKSKTNKKTWDETDLIKVFKEGKAFLLLGNTALASYQKRIGLATGVAPGSELLSAYKIAKEKEIPISLCDRNIQITLQRAWRLSNFWNKVKLLGSLISSAFSKEKVTAEELEELKKNDTLQQMLKEMAKELPGAKKALIDERDTYLATNIYLAPGEKKLAAIGAGHAGGILQNLERLEKGEQKTDLSDISVLPPKSKASALAGWIIPLLIVGLIVFGAYRNGWQQGLRMFLYWAATNASFTFLFAILANAHPLNWLVAAITAPISVLSPVLGVGIFTGVAETRLRRPTIKDYEALGDDSLKLKGWFKNKILHALVVFFMTSIGSILGTFVGFPVLLNLMS